MTTRSDTATREAFEAWHLRTYHMPATQHYTGTGYGGEAADRWQAWQAATAAATQRAERLEAALREIAVGDGYYGAQAREYKDIARAALRSTTETQP